MFPAPIIFNTSIVPVPITINGTFSTAAMPTISDRRFFGYCSGNGIFYFLGGISGSSSGGTQVLTFQSYNVSTNTVTQLQAPASVGSGATMSYSNGKIYSHRSTNQMQVYDVQTNTWTTLTISGFTGNINTMCSSAIVGDIMYIHGGYDTRSTSYSSSLYAYNIISNEWSVLASSPIDTTKGAAMIRVDLVSDEGNLYLSSTNGLHRYDISTNTWSTINSVAYYYGRMVMNNGNLYVLNAGSATPALMRFNFNTSGWEICGSSTTKIVGGCLLSENNLSDKLFSIGGYITTTSIGTIYKIT